MSFATRISDRRTLQIATVSLVLIVVLALLFLDTLGRPQETIDAWIVTRSVTAGTTIDPSSVRLTKLPAARETYAYSSSSPAGKLAAHSLSAGDVVRPDDLTTSPVVTVPVKLTGFQPVTGDSIDIYLVDNGRVSLIGRGIAFVGGAGIQVPASDESLWVALYGSSTPLVATRSTGAGVDSTAPVSAADAARQLAAIAATGAR